MPNGPETVSYSVSVSGINLVDNQMIAITSSAVNVTETMHTIDILPYSNYTAEVVAFTSAGFSPSRTATIQTPEAGEDGLVIATLYVAILNLGVIIHDCLLLSFSTFCCERTNSHCHI